MVDIKVIEIANIPIGIESRYEQENWSLDGFVTSRAPFFSVSVSDEELAECATGKYRDAYKDLTEEKDQERSLLFGKIGRGLAAYDAFIFHAAVVVVDGFAYGFTAPSGMGKSTHVSNYIKYFGERAYILNGDVPVLRFVDGQMYACGTPWKGKERFGEAGMAPLKGFCILERAKKNSITKANLAKDLSRLITQTAVPAGAESFAKHMDLINKFVTNVPIYLLRCNMDVESAKVSFEGMQGE